MILLLRVTIWEKRYISLTPSQEAQYVAMSTMLDLPAGRAAWRSIGNIAFAIASRHGFVQSVVGVSDEAIRAAQHALWEDVRVVTEPGGATALAALLSGVYRPAGDERVGLVLCGGNASLLQVAEAS